MRTTIDINDAQLAELRERARQSKRSFRKVVEEVLHLGLSTECAPSEPIDLPSFAVGIKPAYRGLSMNQLYDQIESEDFVQKR